MENVIDPQQQGVSEICEEPEFMDVDSPPQEEQSQVVLQDIAEGSKSRHTHNQAHPVTPDHSGEIVVDPSTVVTSNVSVKASAHHVIEVLSPAAVKKRAIREWQQRWS